MDIAISSDYKGEFIPIQKAMNQILDSLNNALFQINRTSDQVSNQSQRMAADAQVLSSGVVQQASAVEELSASIQALSDQVGATSKDADTARSFSTDAAIQLQACNQKGRPERALRWWPMRSRAWPTKAPWLPRTLPP